MQEDVICFEMLMLTESDRFLPRVIFRLEEYTFENAPSVLQCVM